MGVGVKGPAKPIQVTMATELRTCEFQEIAKNLKQLGMIFFFFTSIHKETRNARGRTFPCTVCVQCGHFARNPSRKLKGYTDSAQCGND